MSSISLLSKISCSLLSLVKIVVSGLDTLILIGVLSGLESVEILCALDFLLVAGTLLLQLSQFITGVINFLTEGMTRVRFLGNITLSGKDLSLTARDLLSGGSDLGLQVVV